MLNFNNIKKFIEQKNNIKLTPIQCQVLKAIIRGDEIYTTRGIGRTMLYNGYADYLKEVAGRSTDYSVEPEDFDSVFTGSMMEKDPEMMKMWGDVYLDIKSNNSTALGKDSFNKEFECVYDRGHIATKPIIGIYKDVYCIVDIFDSHTATHEPFIVPYKVHFDDGDIFKCGNVIYFHRDIGKKVFLSLKEAEQALRKLATPDAVSDVILAIADDWQGLYFNDKLVTEGHSVSTYKALVCLSRMKVNIVDMNFHKVNIDDEWMRDAGTFPKNFKEIPQNAFRQGDI